MISDSSYNVFTSLLFKKEKPIQQNDTIQIMIFLNESEIKIFELRRKAAHEASNNSDV